MYQTGFDTDTTDVPATYAPFAFDPAGYEPDPAIDGSTPTDATAFTQDGVLHIDRASTTWSDVDFSRPELLLSSQDLVGAAAFPSVFTISLEMGGTPGSPSWWGTMIKFDDRIDRDIVFGFHPGFNGSNFQYNVAGEIVPTAATQLFPQFDVLYPVTMTVIALEGSYQFDLSVTDPTTGDVYIDSRLIDYSYPMTTIGIGRWGPGGGDAIFDNLVISTSVPEPSTALLLTIGFLGLGLCGRRRAPGRCRKPVVTVRKFACLVVVVLGSMLGSERAQATTSFSGLGSLDGGSSRGLGVSGDGLVVVGISGTQAFRWTQETGMVSLGGGPAPVAEAASFDGSAITGTTQESGASNVFRWTEGGGFADLGGGADAQANGISGDGSTITGFSNDRLFRWTESDGFEILATYFSKGNDISLDGSVIAGMRNLTGGGPYEGLEAFRRTESEGIVGLGDLPGGIFRSAAFGASADGSVIVGFATSGSGEEVMRWSETTGMVGLGLLPGASTGHARDVSGDGSVVVGVSGGKAFIWNEDDGMQVLAQVLIDSGLDLSGWTLSEARSISLDGRTIVGFGSNPSGQTEGWIATIPEPSTGLLLGMGLLGLGIRRRSSASHLLGLRLIGIRAGKAAR